MVKAMVYFTKKYIKDNLAQDIEDNSIAYTSGTGALFKSGIPVGTVNNNNLLVNFYSDFRIFGFGSCGRCVWGEFFRVCGRPARERQVHHAPRHRWRNAGML